VKVIDSPGGVARIAERSWSEAVAMSLDSGSPLTFWKMSRTASAPSAGESGWISSTSSPGVTG